MALVSAKRSRLQTAAEQGVSWRQVGNRAAGGPHHAAVGDPDRHHVDHDLHRPVRRRDLRRTAGRETDRLRRADQYTEELAKGIVVLIITFVTLIIGEIVPKRVALLHRRRRWRCASPRSCV
jgi:putative hemolysin